MLEMLCTCPLHNTRLPPTHMVAMSSLEIGSPTNGGVKDEHQGEAAPQNPTIKFVIVGLIRWLGTALLAVLFYLNIFFHQGRTLTSGQKTVFDALVVAISLALGLNSAASLRHIAMHAKRWVEERRQVEVKDVCAPLPLNEQ